MGHFLSVWSDKCPFSSFGAKGWFSAGQNGLFGHLPIFLNSNFLSFRAVRIRYGKIVSRLSFLSYCECYFILSLLLSLGQLLLFRRGWWSRQLTNQGKVIEEYWWVKLTWSSRICKNNKIHIEMVAGHQSCPSARSKRPCSFKFAFLSFPADRCVLSNREIHWTQTYLLPVTGYNICRLPVFNPCGCSLTYWLIVILSLNSMAQT